MASCAALEWSCTIVCRNSWFLSAVWVDQADSCHSRFTRVQYVLADIYHFTRVAVEAHSGEVVH